MRDRAICRARCFVFPPWGKSNPLTLSDCWRASGACARLNLEGLGEMTLRPLKLLSSMAAREVLAELIKGFTAASGQPVAAEAAGGVDVAKRIQAGESAD